MIKIKQIFESNRIKDIASTTREQLSKTEISELDFNDKRIAIAIGSRGIDNLHIIVKEVVQFLKEKGALPFIVPAMGSHGNSTDKGQKDILNSYGINEYAMGIPVISSMETVEIGVTKSGIKVYLDKVASKADMIIPINRVKPHTDFKGEIESGLCKILAIGLGNQKGCTSLHERGIGNFNHIIPEVASFIISHTNVGFGVAIVEDSYNHIAIINTILSDNIISEEKKLLEISKKMMPKIMIPEIDVLIVENFGKNISGAGMDPNVTGRTSVESSEGFKGPKIKRIVVLNLTDESHGNACAISCADFITKQFFDKINFQATYKNSIACYNPRSAQIPIVADDEETAIAMAISSCQNVTVKTAKIVRIKDTLSLGEIYISESLISTVKKNDRIIII